MYRTLLLLLLFLLIIGFNISAKPSDFYPILYENNFYIGFPDNDFNKPLAAHKYKPDKFDYFKIHLLNDSSFVLECKNNFFVQQIDSFYFATASNIEAATRFLFRKKIFNSFNIFNTLHLPVTLNPTNPKISSDSDNVLLFNNTYYVISNNVVSDKDKYFTANEIVFLAIGFTFIFFSLILFIFYKNYYLSVLLLLLGTLLLRIFVAILYPNLFLWDEQFHALVAKNMVNNPFKPVLFKNPVLPFDPNSWVSNHVWLHKYPFFLWLMSFSISIFGTASWAVRLPSAILMTITSYFLYEIASFLYNNKKIGYWAAFLFSVSHFTYLLSSGYSATDHNDVAFIFSISASLWAYFKYLKTNKTYWAILIGVFSGFSFLNKWILGIFTFLFWILHYITAKIVNETTVFQIKHFFISLLITVLIAGSWQLYILLKYYDLAVYEFKFSSLHLFEPIEGHDGPFIWHFKKIFFIYGLDVLLLLAILILGIVNYSNLSLKISISITIIAVYVFFGISKTKMTVFPYPFSFYFIYSCLAYVLHVLLKTIVDLIKNKNLSTFISLYLVVLIGLYSFNLEKVHYSFKVWKKNEYEYNTRSFKTAKFIYQLRDFINTHSGRSWILFNSHPAYYDSIKFMFFTDVLAAYNFIPKKDELQDLIKKNYSIIILDNENIPLDFKKFENTYLLKGYWEIFR